MPTLTNAQDIKAQIKNLAERLVSSEVIALRWWQSFGVNYQNAFIHVWLKQLYTSTPPIYYKD